MFVLLALASVLALLAVVGTFPLVVRRATDAVIAARSGTGRSVVAGVEEFVGRRMSPFLVTVDNEEAGIRGSGTLVQDVFVVTAAHNVARLDEVGRVADVVTHPTRLAVSIREKWSLTLQTRRVVKVWVHKAFSSGVGSVKMVNIAILQLESAFDKRPATAPDFWQSATLATAADLSLERHGTSSFSAAFGRVSATASQVRREGPDFVGPASSQIVLCGDAYEWLQNNDTLCFAPRSISPPHVCSGDTGGPLSVVTDAGTTVVVGIITSGPAGCLGESTPHRWGVAVSVSKLRDWIDAVLRSKPFGASEAAAATSNLVDHDAWRDGDNDGEVFCTDKGTFRVMGQGAKPEQWRARHCSTGRDVDVAKDALKRCDKPCRLQLVRTTEQTLENIAERNFAVMCSKTSRAAYRATGRTSGFAVSNSVKREVQSCAGGVPEWIAAETLEPCPESACLATAPVDFESALSVVCDRLGNAALLTGQAEGWYSRPSMFVPVYFQDKRQVVPCHGGPAQWLYHYSARPCNAMETARCRGPEGTPRRVSAPSVLAPPVMAGTADLDQFEELF